jgi:hypothetical protein
MDSFHFKRGKAFFSSDSTAIPWAAAFEDEGPSGYFYARDRTRDSMESSILDAMLIYNNGSLEEPDREHLASIQWSRDGLQCVLYIDGTAQAFIDFAARQSFCRSNFPNFLDDQNAAWRSSSHAWNDAVIERFEAAIYA